MTRSQRDMDEYAKRTLSPLKPVPSADPKMMADEKARFLANGENLRSSLIPMHTHGRRGEPHLSSDRKRGLFSQPISRALVVVLLVLLFVGASSLTVYAAQASLPGDPLYTVKSASEDIRLSLTLSDEARLNLTMDYTNHRVDEIQTLVSQGKSLPGQASERYQHELDEELQLAAQMNDQAMQSALLKIKAQAEGQGMTMDELIAHLPNPALPAFIRLQERLEEQVQLSTIGEKNPQAFRKEIQAREHNRHGPKKQATTEQSEFLSTESATSIPSVETPGSGMDESTKMPDHRNPGNGNHTPNPTHTPKP